MSTLVDQESRPAAVIRALALKNIPAICAVRLAANAAPQLIDGRSEISPRLAGIPYDHLPVPIHESDFRCTLGFLHGAPILARTRCAMVSALTSLSRLLH
jgi:hypothetical protein